MLPVQQPEKACRARHQRTRTVAVGRGSWTRCRSCEAQPTPTSTITPPQPPLSTTQATLIRLSTRNQRIVRANLGATRCSLVTGKREYNLNSEYENHIHIRPPPAPKRPNALN